MMSGQTKLISRLGERFGKRLKSWEVPCPRATSLLPHLHGLDIDARTGLPNQSASRKQRIIGRIMTALKTVPGWELGPAHVAGLTGIYERLIAGTRGGDWLSLSRSA